MITQNTNINPLAIAIAVKEARKGSGCGTIVGENGQCAQGRYNVADNTSAYIVGNGTDDENRSNAFTVSWDGDVWCDGDIEDGSGNILSDKADKITFNTHKNNSVLDHPDGSVTSVKIADGAINESKLDNSLRQKINSVDQTYTPQSSNAQSGIAVAQAIASVEEYTREQALALLCPKSEKYTGNIDDAIEHDMLDYTIYGNTITTGTPSIDNPATIESCGDLVTDQQSEYYGKYAIPIVVNGVTMNIYLDKPLRKVGDSADTLNFENKILTTQTWAKTLTQLGASEVSINSKGAVANNVICFSLTNWGAPKCASNTTYSSYFPLRTYSQRTQYEGIAHHPDLLYYLKYFTVSYSRLGLVYENVDGTNIIYEIGDETKTPLTDAQIINKYKTWATQFTDPIIFDRATPTQSEIASLPAIPLTAGTNTITVNTTVAPSNFEKTYYQDINKVVAKLQAQINEN